MLIPRTRSFASARLKNACSLAGSSFGSRHPSDAGNGITMALSIALAAQTRRYRPSSGYRISTHGEYLTGRGDRRRGGRGGGLGEIRRE